MPCPSFGRPRRGAALYSGLHNYRRPPHRTRISQRRHPAVLAPSFGVRIVARSHAGRVRPNNEDAVAFSADDGVACLADGMGGLNAGEVASRHAVDSVLRGLLEGLPMESVVRDANRGIWERSCADAELHNMGTTLVALRLSGDNLWLANVGDSRIYRFRERALTQLTHDHSVVQQYVDSGLMSEKEARVAPNRNIITRALGIEGDVEVDVLQEQPAGGDVYMLCSDGVTDMLAPDQLQALFVAHPQPENLVDVIVDSANEAGGVDNISVVLVQLSRVAK